MLPAHVGMLLKSDLYLLGSYPKGKDRCLSISNYSLLFLILAKHFSNSAIHVAMSSNKLLA